MRLQINVDGKHDPASRSLGSAQNRFNTGQNESNVLQRSPKDHDPDLMSLVRNEPGFDPEAKNAGSIAFGLLQFIRST